ncbi:MAG: type II toxin-antitoxin system VapC family toxin [Gammaproteobacteria bacterium]|nr:MAG: type II toxin-antitoxin system VapC family toxin [Gammaproteobacteria bacterium]
MVILDTNVVSELLRAAPARQVEAWLAAQAGADVYLTAITEAELRYGAALVPSGRRQRGLLHAIDSMLREDFFGRILVFDSVAAEHYAEIAVARRAAGRPISQFDCQIAAIARAQGAVLATRNVADFADCGVELVDPWRYREDA